MKKIFKVNEETIGEKIEESTRKEKFKRNLKRAGKALLGIATDVSSIAAGYILGRAISTKVLKK